MADYIDRDAVYHAISVDGGLNAYEKAYCIDVVRKITAADVAPVRRGRWLGWGKSGTPTYENYGTCSECGEDAEIYTEHRNYCPNCGARMDGGDKNDE